jgi:drug/metabolite transporter superfamily protein YnfA
VTWTDKLKERLPTIPEESVTLGLIAAGALATLALAVIFPAVAAAIGAIFLVTAVCSGVANDQKSQKGVDRSGSLDSPAMRAGAYFSIVEQEQETASRRFQDMVSNQDQSQGRER